MAIMVNPYLNDKNFGPYITQSIELDGVNQYVRGFTTSGATNSLSGYDKGTMCIWFKTSTTQYGHLHSKFGENGQFTQTHMATTGQVRNWIFESNTIRKRYETTAGFNDGQWHHAVSTYDLNTQDYLIYVDGALQTVTKPTDNFINFLKGNNSGRYKLGCRGFSNSDTATEFFDGKLTGACAFGGVALNLSQIQEFTAGAVGQKIRPRMHSRATDLIYAYDFPPIDDATSGTGIIHNNCNAKQAVEDLQPINTVAGDITGDVP
jgi:hypothetical protein